MNPAKCVFGVQAGDFLGFIVHQRGIEVPEDKASKIQSFSPLLNLQGHNEFIWEPKHQEAFDKIKSYLASPPVLVPPRAGFVLKLYISAAEASNGSLLAQDDEEGIEHAIFYLSRILTDCETRYTPMEKLCLTLYFLACKLRHYMLSFTTCIIAQTDLVKYMLSRPILRGLIGKWVLALSEFSLQYVTQKAVKGQAIADFLAHHPIVDVPATKELEIATTTIQPDLARIPEYVLWYQAIVSLQPWVLFFDGSCTETLSGAGVVLENPAGYRFSYSFQLEFKCTNNQAEYEALIIGLEVLLELGVRDVQVRGQSLLVINQLQEKYRCVSCLLVPYLNRVVELLDQYDDVGLEHILRERNFASNELAQLATGSTLKYRVRERISKVERRTLPSWLVLPDPPDEPVVAVLEPIDVDWRIPLIDYLKHPDPIADRNIRFLPLNYFLRGEELHRRGEDGIDFRCVYGRKAKRLMREVHEDQQHLIGEDYVQAMWQEHEDLSRKRLEALDSLVMEMQQITRAYNKRTRGHSYKEGEIVWKAVLPFGEKLTGRGKWTPRWEGPFVIHRILERGAFQLKDLDGDLHRNPINGRFLKKYYPSVWEFEDPPDPAVPEIGGQT
ncbi:uncharacterized protein LOC121049261 [Rosa chinensis]|uniref:uncharacterized protein LOC121049261 n=1 Tax=Rosa chinensis TaxID=74649 RepID=UPI001AD90CCF|nr:uncharacterized protein LOC121049261 [Rosa chinensis]